MKDRLEHLAPDDKVVAELPNNLTQAWTELDQAQREADELKTKLLTKIDLVKAKNTIFWSEVQNLSEICETSHSRGMMLTLKKNGDKIAVIESRQPELPNLPDFLKMLGGQ